ncbi:pyruvate,water dikinase [Salinibacter ruber]|uniref:Phosphoenolpyruvate synthase n=2 Tax=Salinibacter ruber TaxID=146919 RepID=A0A9X2ZST6_9BACT|nr:phosphoenolpyruvate synthase [Salinibacter ruber]MCS3656741.1 pyruvate,water dikinase [Salinibacter ruber]MCS3951907.1 pyruvate,water dikinase [Salinibacter ruber]MCS4118364.1 pyruvate,water dikinase [Salinibacter ruber]MCS4154272.1 pyruvate,water dikinase [Salinibacter ruber]MCS4170689.1 pyruvate,water dikinase [Salinibacter ruber]
MPMSPAPTFVRRFDTLTNNDVPIVGGKNASLGEMIGALKDEGIRVPDGFATTADAYWHYLDANELEAEIRAQLAALSAGEQSLAETGAAIRDLIRSGTMPDEMAGAILEAYRALSAAYDADAIDVAARSSATAEDLPEASFAGQQESFLNVRGDEAVLDACTKCFASLFTDRAVTYREEQGFDHMEVALSVGLQKMVRADKAGVMFTIDTESGFPDNAIINAGWGLGETVVKGSINPDQYTVYKPFLENEALTPIVGKTKGDKAKKIVYAEGDGEPTKTVETTEEERNALVLSDDEILTLARWGARIEEHYDRPMDIEWARDGETEALFILQARPETVQSQRAASVLRTYRLQETGERLVTGLSIGQSIAEGEVQLIHSADEIEKFEEGGILVTDMTDPDWGPILKKAAGIVTNHGGRTSHAAIVSRELGIPAVIGTENATETLTDGQEVTLSCVEGAEGYVYEGLLEYDTTELDLDALPETETRIMLNVASPAAALNWWRLPAEGIGLARMEYIVNNVIEVHPMALVAFDQVEDEAARARIEELTQGYDDKTEYFVDQLSRGVGSIAATQYPDPVLVRTSDFKTNEYADLIGGQAFEPHEENPMLGWRGASRYYSDEYRDGFALECRALKRVRETMGFTNVVLMIPFCRTPAEADRVLEVMAEHGLQRGENGLEVYVMAEIPSNVLQADEFAERLDGFSIGTNDLTQLVLGVGRDAERLAALFDERNRSVKKMIVDLIEQAHAADRPVGLCGQAPSDHPDFAEFLVEAGIESISVIPDSVADVIQHVAEAEQA